MRAGRGESVATRRIVTAARQRGARRWSASSGGRARAPSLQRFSLEDLAPFTKEGAFSKDASQDFHLFYVGRDDVHGILKYLLSRAQTSLYLNLGRALARCRRFGE